MQKIECEVVKTAIITGASGLTGSCLLQLLLDEPGYDEVIALVRKELPIKHHKLQQIIVDFDHLDNYSNAIKGDAIFCLLGSTKKKTPDLAVYRKIDHDYPVKLAEIALRNKIGQYHLMSSIGANGSSSNFYTKMKGQTEQDITDIGLPATYIYRPSFLVGNRKENRPLEKVFVGLMTVINPLLFGGIKKYRSIRIEAVASAMYKQSLKNEPGVQIYESDKIQELS